MTEILAGMLGPLAAAVVSWVVAVRTYRRNRQALTSVMVTAFGVKMAFFAGYVILLLKGLGLEPATFATSLVASLIVFHTIEAVGLKRLFAEGLR